MARSPKEDPRYNEMQHNKWNYCAEAAENCAPGALNDRSPPPVTSGSSILPDNSMYANANFGDDVYLNKHPFNVPTNDPAVNMDDKIPFNNVPRPSQNYGNAMLKLGNGQLVRVFIDENHLIFPMSGQYELFNPNQGVLDSPLQASQSKRLYQPQDFSTNNNLHIPTTATQNSSFQDNMNTQPPKPSSNFLNDLLGNLEPTTTGTYSPFGQNYPLNHPDLTSLNMLQNNTVLDMKNLPIKVENSPKRNENSPLADTSTKKRIVAEVKPMRPSYSDVLAKNTKNTQQTDVTRKPKPQNVDSKPTNNKVNNKQDKLGGNTKLDDHKHKNDKKQNCNTISSGSESGDINTEDNEKRQKPAKKSKNKRSNMSRKWSSLDDIANEESYAQENESQFMFIENQDKPKKDKKSNNKMNSSDDRSFLDDDDKFDEEDNNSSFYQEGQGEAGKSKKKKDARGYHKAAKPVLDKKKTTQTKVRRNKPGYLGMAQNYLEHWGGASWKALTWFFYLLSDICGMSLHLSFDLCTSVFTQTYVSSQAVWRSSKDWFAKIAENKYLMYIDRKLGHTRLGFWRKLKWFKKDDDSDAGGNGDKLDSNIPLPGTGEEAMKRLLACKGKDPYSILGVSVNCSDDEIKRYYRRQAFLVHPDKNQQPGAEEAFKILQHAFDLIGEPERRAEYARRALESRHAEAAWGELSDLLAQLHDKMEFAANTIRCTNCGRRHKRVLTDRPCYAARYCAQCKIRHSAKEGDIWAESSMLGLLVMYYACMDGAVYQITQWASCQKKNLKQLRPDCHAVQYRIVLGNKATGAHLHHRVSTGHDPNLEEFLNNLYSKTNAPTAPPADPADAKKRRAKKPKA